MMRSKNSSRGFTLIELLVVIVVLAILMLILLPIIQSAIQKTKQKATMSDMGELAKAIMGYVTDTGSAPTSPNGDLASDSQLVVDLTPMHKNAFSTRDNWGTPFRVWTGLNVAGVFSIDSAGVGTDDFVIQSLGRDAQDEGFSYDPTDSSNNFYILQDITDFSRDLILGNGGWIHAPRAGN
jgi:prepilin-type N-terminal cleavage/methylation domain-containing protein